MNQQDLRDWEKRCIQEEQPWCQAACPLHVDARGFMERMKAGDFDAARKILEKTMPLPGVLANICDHPCEDVCKRREAGDPLAIGRLERVAINLGRPGPKPLVLPAKNKKAAVLGGGLAALTCAWDLARKGYSITIFCPDDLPGGRLRALPPHLLLTADLDREIGRLTAMGVMVETGRSLAPELLNEVRSGFDAVFVEFGALSCPPKREDADAVTLLLIGDKNMAGQDVIPPGGEAVFCGGWPGPGGLPSAIGEAADGRRAAASMDRHMSGASLTASREKEGPTQTRLFTSLAGIDPLPRVIPGGSGEPEGQYDGPEASREAARCLHCQCLECVKVCAYLEHYQGHPKKYARQIYNNAAIVQGVHQSNKMINTCMLCGLCTEVCPERFSMAELCLTARRDMVERSKMPQSAHEFALEDMAFNNGPHFAMAKPEPGADRCEYVFFPGCQLAASHPHHVAAVYGFLRSRLTGGVGLMTRCCGVPALWAGRDDLFEEASGQLLRSWKDLGFPRVITACSSCLAVFKEHIPELAPVSIWEVFGQTGLPASCGPKPGSPVALHDPCTTRQAEPVREAVRKTLRALDVPFEELALGGRYTECCGYGGLAGNAHPEIARLVASRRAAESPLDFAASCSMCRDRLAAEGKRVWHVLDFVFPGPDVEPSAKGPGFSERHERRARLKAALLRDVWGETAVEPGEESGCATPPDMAFAPGVLELLEERRILLEDVQAVVARAERTGRKLLDKASGRFLAYYRPRRVTYWVEYALRDGLTTVTRAWSHRMEVPGAAGEDQS
jgi:Fe-S oxidoreductase